MFVHMCLCIVYIFQAEDSERIRQVSPVVWVRTRSSETNSGLLRHKKRVNSSSFGHVMRPIAYVIHKLVITHRKSWNKAALRTHCLSPSSTQHGQDRPPYTEGFPFTVTHSNTVQNPLQNWLDLLYGGTPSKLGALLSGPHWGTDVHLPITSVSTCHVLIHCMRKCW